MESTDITTITSASIAKDNVKETNEDENDNSVSVGKDNQDVNTSIGLTSAELWKLKAKLWMEKYIFRWKRT